MTGGFVTVKRKRRVWPFVVGGLAVLVVVGLGIAVAVAVFGNHPPPALDDYMHGKGVSYRSDDRHAIVRLPKSPDIEPMPGGVDGSVASATNEQYEVGFFEVHPGAVLNQANARPVLDRFLEGEATGAGMRLSDKHETTFGGHLALVGNGNKSGDQVELLVVYANNSVYGAIVHTKHGAADVMHELQQSLQISGR
jgi:hypothetical protein